MFDKTFKPAIAFSAVALLAFSIPANSRPAVDVFESREGVEGGLTQSTLAFSESRQDVDFVISVDTSTGYQPILGIGASFEHSTCWNLMQLDPALRQETLERIVHPGNGIGMNIMRICIGSPDFTPDDFYSYSEPPEGELDLNLDHFSIDKDRAYVLPILKQALEINPGLLFTASPWSPPAWMKTNGSMQGGRMNPEYYGVYADYFVKFIQAYENEGIPIHAVTPQNEPDYPNRHYPTCHWTADEQNEFIRDHLGPAFEEAGLDVEIWCWDHNWHLLEFPRTILNDPVTAGFVDGVGFHLYEGEVEAQTELHQEFPDVPIYFTEGSTFETGGAIEIIEILRNWSRSYMAWVIVLDQYQEPNNGPHDATPTCIERLLADNTVRYNFDYFMYGHFSKFIQRGARRIDSTEGDRRFANVAFQNPDGSIVAIVANDSDEAVSFELQSGGQAINDTLAPQSLKTYRWVP